MSPNKSYQVNWTLLAEESYSRELEFINLKWNTKEVVKFMGIVDDIVEKLQSGIIEGNISKKTNYRSLVISKQTTLFFEKFEQDQQINLLLFWNNKSDPKHLIELLNFYK